MKTRKIGKIIYWVIFILCCLAVGAFAGWHAWLTSIGGSLGLLCILLLVVLVFDLTYKKIWPKTTPAEKEPKIKILIRTTLQLVMGGTFGYGIIGIILRLLDGREDGFALYIGLIVMSVVIFILLLKATALQDQCMKEGLEQVKRERKNYGKDERLQAIGSKTGEVTLGITLMMILIFGALVSVFEPTNLNFVTVGLLCLFGTIVLLYWILFTLYDSEKLDIDKQTSLLGNLVRFLLSFIPSILLVIRWVLTGLSSVSIAFLVTFLLISVYLAVHLWYEKKYC